MLMWWGVGLASLTGLTFRVTMSVMRFKHIKLMSQCDQPGGSVLCVVSGRELFPSPLHTPAAMASLTQHLVRVCVTCGRVCSGLLGQPRADPHDQRGLLLPYGGEQQGWQCVRLDEFASTLVKHAVHTATVVVLHRGAL